MSPSFRSIAFGGFHNHVHLGTWDRKRRRQILIDTAVIGEGVRAPAAGRRKRPIHRAPPRPRRPPAREWLAAPAPRRPARGRRGRRAAPGASPLYNFDFRTSAAAGTRPSLWKPARRSRAMFWRPPRHRARGTAGTKKASKKATDLPWPVGQELPSSTRRTSKRKHRTLTYNKVSRAACRRALGN